MRVLFIYAVFLCFAFTSALNIQDTQMPVQEVCYEHYGCFSTESPWTSSLLGPRPWGAVPKEPHEVGTVFLLHTRTENRDDPYELLPDKDPLFDFSPFDEKKKTVFLLHGFTDSRKTGYMEEIKEALLNQEDINLIVIDWSPGAKGTYLQATANARLAGAQATRFIMYLEKRNKAKVEDLTIIAHSLGAHVAGYIGDRLHGRLGRIIALDPTGPYFEGTDPMVRLDKSDAQHVHVTHSNGDGLLSVGLGQNDQCGHVDVYINGGKSQPGCNDLIGNFFSTLWYFITFQFDEALSVWACSHARAAEYFLESLKSSCPFVSQKCKNENEFDNGNCVTSCALPGSCTRMGAGSELFPEAFGTYHLRVQKSSPHCLESVRFDGAVSTSQKKTNGNINIAFKLPDGSFSEYFEAFSGSMSGGSVLNRWLEIPGNAMAGKSDLTIKIMYKRGGLLPPTEEPQLKLDSVNLYVIGHDLKLHVIRYKVPTLDFGEEFIVSPSSLKL